MNDFKTITRWKGCQVCLFPMPFCVSTIFCITSSRVITTASLWAFWCGVHVIPWRLVCRQNTWHAMVAQSAHSRHNNDITTMNQHRCRLLIRPESTKQKHSTLTETKNIKSQSFILHIQEARFSCCCILTLWYSVMLYMLKITWQYLSSPYLYSSLLQITPGILLSPQSVKSPVFSNVMIYTVSYPTRPHPLKEYQNYSLCVLWVTYLYLHLQLTETVF